MTTDQTAQANTQREASSAPAPDNWAAVTNAFKFDEPQPVKLITPAAEPTPTTTTPDAKNEGSTETAEETVKPSTDETNISGVVSPDAKSEPAKTGEEGTQNTQTEPPVKPIVEFSPDDIKLDGVVDDAKPVAEDGTWLAVAQAKGLEIKEDSVDSFIEAIVAPVKKELEEVKAVSLEKYLEKLKPETAAAIKLTEMGYDDRKYYEDKQQVKSLLSKEDVELVRANLEAEAKINTLLTPELIDHKIEQLAGEPTKLKLAADSIRLDLKTADQQIDNYRNTLIQQYEERTRQAAEVKRNEEHTTFKKALDTAEKFMDIPLNPELKERVYKKFAAGGYDTLFNDPSKKVDLIFYAELGQKYLASIKNTAFENGREEIIKKESNIPPVKQAAGSVTTPNQQTDNWSALKVFAQK